LAKFSRFDPRNKKNGRHKKMTIGELPRGAKKNTADNDDDKYLRKYKKIDIDDEVDEELGWAVR